MLNNTHLISIGILISTLSLYIYFTNDPNSNPGPWKYLHFKPLNSSDYPLAVCNDGTQAGFYFRKGDPSHPQRWIIYLKGGGCCYNQENCNDRPSERRSSKDYEDKITLSEGIFSQDCDSNPFWCEANFVYVPYCTSDFYSGDRAASSETYNFHFRGSRVVEAIIKELTTNDDYGLGGYKDSNEILFTGESAGGKGAVYNMDKVGKTLKNAKAFTDSDWWIDIDSMSDDIMSFVPKAKSAYNLWNAQMNPDCVNNYDNEPWMCIFPYKNEPYFKMPHLTQEFQYDSFQLGKLTNEEIMDKTQESLKYAETFRKYMVSTFDNLNIERKSALFSPGCKKHVSMNVSGFNDIKINDINLSKFLLDWFTGKIDGNDAVLIDQCIGFNCGTGCPYRLSNQSKF